MRAFTSMNAITPNITRLSKFYVAAITQTGISKGPSKFYLLCIFNNIIKIKFTTKLSHHSNAKIP